MQVWKVTAVPTQVIHRGALLSMTSRNRTWISWTKSLVEISGSVRKVDGPNYTTSLNRLRPPISKPEFMDHSQLCAHPVATSLREGPVLQS